MKKIGILTGGGDAPGLNAVIRAVALTARNRYGWEVVGIREGFDGLVHGSATVALPDTRVYELLARGGTILGAVNRGNPFTQIVTRPDGTEQIVDVSEQAIARIHELGLDALVAAGGDGTMAIAQSLVARGVRIVGVPKTIDNDLGMTDVTFGFDTAILTATEALDKLQTTAESHHRIMIMEVMGRDAGWIALYSGIAGGADAILIPEIPFHIARIAEKMEATRTRGRRYGLVVVAEGAAMHGGDQQYYIGAKGNAAGRLGGIGYTVGNLLAETLDADVRVTVLGHLQRGGQPTPRDRFLATQFGHAAVELIAQEKWGYMAALRGNQMVPVLMSDAIRQMNAVDPNGHLVAMARDLGITFGD
jgi:ATP-dependent phosphofructokinase / diphosphate-dependent phosphofructokinase